MLRRRLEVFVGTQQRELMAQTELGNECGDGSHLHADPAACILELCSGNVIFSSRLDQRQRGESLDDLCAGLRAGKSLKQFLQDKPRHDHDICPQQCFFQVLNFRLRSVGILAKGQRPDARIDEECHERDRSAL